jgi:hypothetical protein
MKSIKIIPTLLLSLALLMSQFVLASDAKFVETMQKHIQTVYTSQSVEEIQGAVNAFDRIAEAEKTKWEPFYYSAFGNVMMANKEKDGAKKDTYLDLALKGVESAKAIIPNESEVIALEGFIHMIRVTVDPASRGQQYSGMAFQSFGKAVAVNPENPRALALLAQMQYGMAQFFGSPTTEACATLTKSLEKFESYKSENPLAPQWGKKMAEGLKTKCN